MISFFLSVLRVLPLDAFLTKFATIGGTMGTQHDIATVHAQSDGALGLAQFGTEWDVLGPFQTGTREAVWGADPLERFGGFRTLQRNDHTRFPSSLAENGTVKWSKKVTSSKAAAQVHLQVGFPDIDWSGLRHIYGWAAIQYQAWARGEILVNAPKTHRFALDVAGALEFWVDGHHYFGGDMYSYRQSPLLLELAPGPHRIDVRLVRDVRAMGDASEPNIDIDLGVSPLIAGKDVLAQSTLFPDIVDGTLASALASVTLFNGNSQAVHVTAVTSQHDWIEVVTESSTPSKLVSGQTRPIGLRLNLSDTVPADSTLKLKVSFEVISQNSAQLELMDSVATDLTVEVKLRQKHMKDAHLFTFKHPSGVISKALLRPPHRTSAVTESVGDVPVLLNLHGAGVDVDNPFFQHALDDISDAPAWMVAPQGVTLWSGDDWHAWGWADVEASIAAVQGWISCTSWTGPGVDISRWMVVGHSNGGQGTWYATTHHPDKIIAAAVVSGYSSIQNYVPYQMWSEAEPQLAALTQVTLSNYRHEILLPNAKGIPMILQHGGADDNVPTYHSRHMFKLASSLGLDLTYSERPNEGHWVDGILTTPALRQFYERHWSGNVTLAEELDNFELVVANTAATGTKGGIRVLRLRIHGILGKVRYHKLDAEHCSISTTNIKVLKLSRRVLGTNGDRRLSVDGTDLGQSDFAEHGDIELVWDDPRRQWLVGDGRTLQTQSNLGNGLESILKSKGPFVIKYSSEETRGVALQISRNFHQYFSADTVVESRNETNASAVGNVVTLVVGGDVPGLAKGSGTRPNIVIEDGRVSVTTEGGRSWVYSQVEGQGLAAVYLHPLPDSRLELVLWASDLESLQTASRLVPTVPGPGQPDWIVLTNAVKEKGVGGVKGMGFFSLEEDAADGLLYMT